MRGQDVFLFSAKRKDLFAYDPRVGAKSSVSDQIMMTSATDKPKNKDQTIM